MEKGEIIKILNSYLASAEEEENYCADDVTLEYNGLLYNGDHWNPPTLTAFASDPSTRSGLRVHCFGIEDAEKALEEKE